MVMISVITSVSSTRNPRRSAGCSQIASRRPGRSPNSPDPCNRQQPGSPAPQRRAFSGRKKHQAKWGWCGATREARENGRVVVWRPEARNAIGLDRRRLEGNWVARLEWVDRTSLTSINSPNKLALTYPGVNRVVAIAHGSDNGHPVRHHSDRNSGRVPEAGASKIVIVSRGESGGSHGASWQRTSAGPNQGG